MTHSATAHDSSAVYKKALEHRREIKRVAAPGRLDPTAVYEIAATTLLVLILCWNEYLLSLFLSTSNAQTMPILVAAMNAGERGILWWSMAVVIIVMIIPVALMALVLQRFISKGILLGAVKG